MTMACPDSRAARYAMSPAESLNGNRKPRALRRNGRRPAKARTRPVSCARVKHSLVFASRKACESASRPGVFRKPGSCIGPDSVMPEYLDRAGIAVQRDHVRGVQPDTEGVFHGDDELQVRHRIPLGYGA